MSGRLGTLTLDLIAKIGGFTGPMDKAKKKSEDFSLTLGGLAKAGGIAAGALAAFGAAIAVVIKTTADAGDELRDMALRTGVSVTALSELKHAAELSGASIEELEMGFRKLSAFMMNANQGASSAISTFDTLGIKFKDASGHLRAADDVFMDAVDALNSLSSETEKAAFAQELFGKSGTTLLPLIKEGKTGIAALREEARKLGITFTDLEANQADAFNDSMSRMTKALLGLKNAIGKELIPTFTIILEKITDFITKSESFAWALDLMKDAAKRFISQFIDIRDPLEKLGTLRTELENLKILQQRLAKEESDIMSQSTIARTLFYSGALEQVQVHAIEVAQSIKTMEEAIAAAEQAYIKMNKVIIDVTGRAITPIDPFAMVDLAGRLDPLLEAYLDFLGAKGQADEDFNQMNLDRNIAFTDQQMQIQKAAEQTILNMKFGAANQALALLNIVGQKSKALAMAALVFQKGLAVAQIAIQTATAASAALAPPPLGLGPVAGAPLAASIWGWGKLQMALVVATGIAEAAFGGGGPSGVGGGGGVGSLPINTPTSVQGEGNAAQNIYLTVHTLATNEGKLAEELARILNDAAGRNIRISANIIAQGA